MQLSVPTAVTAQAVPQHLVTMTVDLLKGTKKDFTSNSGQSERDRIVKRAYKILRQEGLFHWGSKSLIKKALVTKTAAIFGIGPVATADIPKLQKFLESRIGGRTDAAIDELYTAYGRRRLTGQDRQKVVDALSKLWDSEFGELEKTYIVEGVRGPHRVVLGWDLENGRFSVQVEDDGEGEAEPSRTRIEGEAQFKVSENGQDMLISVIPTTYPIQTKTAKELADERQVEPGMAPAYPPKREEPKQAKDKPRQEPDKTTSPGKKRRPGRKDQKPPEKEKKPAKVYVWENPETGEMIRQTRFKRLKEPIEYKGEFTEEELKGLDKAKQDEHQETKTAPSHTQDRSTTREETSQTLALMTADLLTKTKGLDGTLEGGTQPAGTAGPETETPLDGASRVDLPTGSRTPIPSQDPTQDREDYYRVTLSAKEKRIYRSATNDPQIDWRASGGAEYGPIRLTMNLVPLPGGIGPPEAILQPLESSIRNAKKLLNSLRITQNSIKGNSQWPPGLFRGTQQQGQYLQDMKDTIDILQRQSAANDGLLKDMRLFTRLLEGYRLYGFDPERSGPVSAQFSGGEFHFRYQGKNEQHVIRASTTGWSADNICGAGWGGDLDLVCNARKMRLAVWHFHRPDLERLKELLNNLPEPPSSTEGPFPGGPRPPSAGRPFLPDAVSLKSMAIFHQQNMRRAYRQILEKVVLLAWHFAPAQEQDYFKFGPIDDLVFEATLHNHMASLLSQWGVMGTRLRLPSIRGTKLFLFNFCGHLFFKFPLTVSGTKTITRQESGTVSEPIEYRFEKPNFNPGDGVIASLNSPDYMNLLYRAKDQWLLARTTGTQVSNKTDRVGSGFSAPWGTIAVAADGDSDQFIGDLQGQWEVAVWPTTGKTTFQSSIHWRVEHMGPYRPKLRFVRKKDGVFKELGADIGFYGGPFFLEARYDSEQQDTEKRALLEWETDEDGNSDGMEIVVKRTAEDPRVYRSEAFYVMPPLLPIEYETSPPEEAPAPLDAPEMEQDIQAGTGVKVEP